MWLQLGLLTFVTFFSWIWANHPQLSFYTLQLIAVLIIIYLLKNLFSRNANLKHSRNILNSLILTTIVLVLVFSTGGLNSSFFFLLYFLLFNISFLFEPSLTMSFSFILVVFLATHFQFSQDLIKLASLIFAAPLALFFGQQYLKNLAAQERIKIFKRKWLENEKALESEETNILLWLSLNLRNSIAEILEITANLLADLSHLSPTQKKSLKKIRRKAKKLLKQGKKLGKIVDRETDDEN